MTLPYYLLFMDCVSVFDPILHRTFKDFRREYVTECPRDFYAVHVTVSCLWVTSKYRE